MRLYEYNEGSRGKKVSDVEGLKILNKYCSKAWNHFLKTDDSLMRGMKMKGDYYHIDPKSSTRVSQNTVNYYTLILDSHPKWTKYPKRSKSLICTNVKRKALNYGTVYRVFPYDNSNMGMASMPDIWDSFEVFPSYLKLGMLNYALQELLSIFNLDDEFQTMKHFEEELDRLERELEDIEMEDMVWRDDNYDLANDLSDNGLFEFWRRSNEKPFYDWFMGLFDPKKNNFMVTKDITKVVNPAVSGNEVWTDGKCLMVGFQEAHYKKLEINKGWV